MTEGTAPNQNQEDMNTQGSNDAMGATPAPQASEGNQQNMNGKLTADNLPQDVRDALPEDAQRLYIAAFNSFYDNSNDREAAARVAWQTIEHNDSYERDGSGKWRRLSEPTAMHTMINETAS